MHKTLKKVLTMIMIFAMVFSMCACGGSEKKNVKASGRHVVVDSRGKKVEVPDKIERVAIIDKGFITQVMTAMDVEDKIVGEGDVVSGAKEPDRDTLILCPKLFDVPNLGYPWDAVDYEAIAGCNPDIVLFRNSEYIKDSEITEEAIHKIEDDLKIPLVVINGPGCNEKPSVQDQYDGIKIMGEVFNKEKRADEIIEMMQETLDMIKERTKDIPEDKRPNTMFISGFDGEKVEGTIWGDNYGDAKFVENLCNIVNVYDKHEPMRKIGAEEILALDPEVMVLCTPSCDPDVLMDNDVYSTLRDVDAIKNRRVVSRGYLTWCGDFRLEIPTIMLIAAKGVYPEQFEDIKVHDWINEYHKKLYGIDDTTAEEIKVAQRLEWMNKADF